MINQIIRWNMYCVAMHISAHLPDCHRLNSQTHLPDYHRLISRTNLPDSKRSVYYSAMTILYDFGAVVYFFIHSWVLVNIGRATCICNVWLKSFHQMPHPIKCHHYCDYKRAKIDKCANVDTRYEINTSISPTTNVQMFKYTIDKQYGWHM